MCTISILVQKLITMPKNSYILNCVKSFKAGDMSVFLRRFFEKMSWRFAEILRRFCGDFSVFA